MSTRTGVNRRDFLLLTAGSLLTATVPAALSLPFQIIYRRSSGDGFRSDEPPALRCVQRIEEKLVELGYRVVLPEPAVQTSLDERSAPALVFLANAGYSAEVSASAAQLNIDTEWVRIEFSLVVRVRSGRELIGSIAPRRLDVKARKAVLDQALAELADMAGRNAAAELHRQFLEGRIRTTEVPAVAQGHAGTTDALAPPRRIRALLVGVSDFSNVRRRNATLGAKLHDLPGVAADLMAMQDALSKLGTSREDIQVLSNQLATADGLSRNLRSLAAAAETDDLVVIFLATHAIVPLTDADPLRTRPVLHDFNLGDSLPDFGTLQTRIRNDFKARVLWIVDTCHAGAAGQGLEQIVVGPCGSSRGLSPVREEVINEHIEAISRRAGEAAGKAQHFALIAAATPSQMALDAGGGLLTRALVDGLRKTDGRVTVGELFRRYVGDEVAERSCRRGHLQQPILAYSGMGEAMRFKG